jgi:hypothetical protein
MMDQIERLERWQQFGAVWRVVAQRSGTVTISLCRCDGGEEVGQIVAHDAQLLAWLGDRTSSEDSPDLGADASRP